MTTPLLPYLLLPPKSGQTTFCDDFILQNNCLKVKKKLHKFYAVFNISLVITIISSFAHVLLSLVVYRTVVQVYLQYKASRPLVAHLARVGTLVETV